MRTLKVIVMCIVVSLFTVTCQKEHLPPPTNGSPVFYFTGNVGGNNISLKGGANNYYMYSSYTQDSIYHYTGTLKEYNCTSGCTNSIQFIINDYRNLGAGIAEKNIGDSSFFVGAYSYAALHAIASYEYKEVFTPSVNPSGDTVASYNFNFGDGKNQSGSSLPSMISHIYPSLTTYTTNLSANFGGGDTSSLNMPVTANIKDTVKKQLFYSRIFIQSHTGYTYYFGDSVYGLNGASYNVSLNFGDGTSSSNTGTQTGVYTTADTFSHTFADTAHVHIVTATLTNVNTSQTCSSATNANPGSNLIPYITYTTSAPQLIPVPATPYSKVTIIYTDASGDVYSSADSTQPSGSDFQIVSVANYQNNENNETTKQLHIKFNCTLYDKNKRALTINNGDAVIAVAYK